MSSRKRLAWQLPALAILIAGTLIVARQQRQMPFQKDSGMVFGTFYNITYQSDRNLKGEIEAQLARVDRSLSPFNRQSVITAINDNRPVTPDDMLLTVFDLAQRVAADTDGAFDITVAPLVNAWGFGFKHGTPPTDKQVDSLLSFTGYKKVRLLGRKIAKDDPRLMLDCSAIAKGYGTDVVARFLQQQGVRNFMVEIGGEIVARGSNPKGAAWTVGVQKPVDDSLATDNAIDTVLTVTDIAMATSGNYRNFYYRGGRKFAHTIDPKTGRPVQHSILSATVLARDCATADAYATAIMVMGLPRAKALLARHRDLQAYIIYDEGGRLRAWSNLRR